ncbi:hypothetical protein SUGI_0362260 [Cryptomeria japonica]|nr:hypothetical protein SUGI_0362260 [Cryptomeria japonica]
MGDTDDGARAFFRRSEEPNLSMSKILEKVAQLLRGFNKNQGGAKPTNDGNGGSTTNGRKSVTNREGSKSNGGKSVVDGEKVSASTKTFKAKFLTNEEVGEVQPE